MKTPENMDLELKSKRIVYQMTRELQRTDVHDDFHNALLTLQMPENDKKAGFEGFKNLQNDIKESLKNYIKTGVKSGFLEAIGSQQMKCVDHMLVKSLKSHVDFDFPPKIDENGEFSGEKIRAKRVQMVDDVADSEDVQPRIPIPFNIPPLQVDHLYDDDNLEESEDLEWISSQPGRSSSRIPEIPMEPVPKFLSHRVPEPVPEQPKQVTFNVSNGIVPPVKKIISRARPIEKSDAQIQTDDQIEEILEEKEEKVDTAEIGTNCRLLITPRVEEDEEHFEEKISEKSSPLLSPISTVNSELSEGEVLVTSSNVIVVRSDGSIVPTPRVLEDVDEDDDDVELSPRNYLGEAESDILIAKSSSPFSVAEIDMSVSSAQSH